MSLDDRVNDIEAKQVSAEEERALLRQGVLRLIDIAQEMRQEFRQLKTEGDQRFEILLQEARADRIENQRRYEELKAEIEARHQEQRAESDRKFEESKAASDRRFEELINRLDKKNS